MALFPVLLLFWALSRVSRVQIGLTFVPDQYGLALLHPLVIVGLLALICLAVGATNTSNADWLKARDEFLTIALPQILLLRINAVVIGALWGLVRLVSGSTLVSSMCHGGLECRYVQPLIRITRLGLEMPTSRWTVAMVETPKIVITRSAR